MRREYYLEREHAGVQERRFAVRLPYCDGSDCADRPRHCDVLHELYVHSGMWTYFGYVVTFIAVFRVLSLRFLNQKYYRLENASATIASQTERFEHRSTYTAI